MFTPAIIVLEEKHHLRFRWARTLEELHASALKILSERHAEGYYFEPELKYYSSKREYSKDLLEYQAIKEALRDEDGEKAWSLLLKRNNAEYENVYLAVPE